MGINDLDKSMLRQIVSDFKKDCGERIVDIILFGSYANGTATSKSDIDILTVLRGTLVNVEDFEAIPKDDYNILWDRYHRVIHSCIASEDDYMNGRIKALRDVPNYGISILSI